MSHTFKVKALLLDIEGTTTSISFVYDELFPYVSQNLETFISSNWNKDEVQDVVEILAEQSEVDARDNLPGVIRIDLNEFPEVVKQTVTDNVKWQMANNRKTTALKKLQGLMYPEGYTSGKLSGHVYDDVKLNLEKWKNDGKNIYIYSSGSVLAQKLIYGYSKDGDLTKFIDGYFDTLVGQKINKDSYVTISQEINLNPNEILFLTDVAAEAIAASVARLQVCLVSRPGNAKLDEDMTKTFPIINSFNSLEIV